MRRAAAIAGCAAALVLPAAAGAAVSLPTGPLLAGPVLGGESLVYVEGARGSYRLWTGDTTLRSGSFEEFDEFTSVGGASFDVGASPSRVGLAIERGTSSQYGSSSALEVFGGPLLSPPAAFAGCSAAMLLGDPPGGRWYGGSGVVAVDGERTAHVDCDESLVVRDGDAVAARLPLRARGAVALAGPYVAVAGSVYDWRDGRRLYTVPGEVADIDVREDGAAVVTRVGPSSHPSATCRPVQAEWWSPAGAGHPLPVTPCVADVALAGSRAALIVGNGARRELVLVGLDGSRTVVADLGIAGTQVGGIDFDGAAVAYALRRCGGGAELFRVGVTETAPRVSAACPVQISRRVAVRGARATVGLRCPAGCSGTVRLRRGSRPLGNARIPAGASGRVAVRLRLGAAARRLVRRGRLRVVVEYANRAGGSRTTAAAVRLR